MAPQFAVVTEGLTKHFGELVAVDHVDLQVPAGSVVALLGPNGAGKTTIVRMLATLSKPTSGSALVGGFDIVHEADAVRGVMSLTGQFAALEANLTARENMILIARLRGYDRGPAKRIVDNLIERLDVGEFRNKLVKSLSGGQRRRVDLAASLVSRPELLVLDEPTTGLDPRSRQVVWALVRELVGVGRHRLAHDPVPRGGGRTGRQRRVDRPRTSRGRRNASGVEGTDRRPARRCRGDGCTRVRAPRGGSWNQLCNHDGARSSDDLDPSSARNR